MTTRTDRGGASHPLVELTRARLLEFVREPEALFWAFIFPIVLSLVLAAAFPSGGSRPVLVGLDPGLAASDLRAALGSMPDVVIRDVPPADEMRALREGEVHLVVRATDPVTYRYDAARDESRTARLVVDDALKRAAGRVDPWTAVEDPIDVPGSRYVDWLIPGIVGLNIMGTSLWGLGFSIVQARLRKLLKRLVASPMRRWEYLLAQVLARLVFLAPEVVVPLAFGVLAFGLPIRGSLVDLTAVAVVGALGFSGIGLLAASRPRTFEAISGVLNFAMLPMWLLSGVFFSRANFPDWLQPIIGALPLTALVDALRLVILEGRTLAGVGSEMAVLTAWGAGAFVLALWIFRWR